MEAERIAGGLIAAVIRDSIGLDTIVRRLDIDAIVARLDIGEIVARLDIDAIIARLDMNKVMARLDFSKLADQVVEDVDLPKVIMQAGTSVVRGRRPRNRI
jgi:hypothetical protein